MSRADSPRYPFSRCFFVPLTRRGHSTSISEVSANADGDEGLTEMASAMQSSASRLMTRCEMSPPLARPGMGLSARPLRCCLFIESPTLPFLLLSSYSRHGISCWRTRNTEEEMKEAPGARGGPAARAGGRGGIQPEENLAKVEWKTFCAHAAAEGSLARSSGLSVTSARTARSPDPGRHDVDDGVHLTPLTLTSNESTRHASRSRTGTNDTHRESSSYSWSCVHTHGPSHTHMRHAGHHEHRPHFQLTHSSQSKGLTTCSTQSHPCHSLDKCTARNEAEVGPLTRPLARRAGCTACDAVAMLDQCMIACSRPRASRRMTSSADEIAMANWRNENKARVDARGRVCGDFRGAQGTRSENCSTACRYASLSTAIASPASGVCKRSGWTSLATAQYAMRSVCRAIGVACERSVSCCGVGCFDARSLSTARGQSYSLWSPLHSRTRQHACVSRWWRRLLRSTSRY